MRFPYHGAGVGLIKDGCLLIGKRSERPFLGKWCVPGGGFEKGIDKGVKDNAVRELFEETGIVFSKLEAVPVCKWTLRVPFFSWTTFYYSIGSFDQKLCPSEFYQLEWVPLEEVKKKHLRPFLAAEVHNLMKNLN